MWINIRAMEGIGEPSISLNEERGELNISGVSMMENTLEYYREIKDKVDVFIEQDALPLTVIFELTYFNSSTAKQFIQLLSKLEGAEKPHKVIWKYPNDHSVMHDRGRELEVLVDVPFEYVAI